MTTTTKAKKLPTHELFDVQQREGQKAFWNKVGAAFENKDGSHSVLLYQPGLPTPKRREVDAIDLAAWWEATETLSPIRRDLHRAFMLTGARRSSPTS